MTEDTTKPTLAERYAGAINSSNLQVRERCTGDVDLLMAAGWSDSLGILLYRLACEYDQVAADIRKTAHDDLTGMLLILMHLKTLNGAREALERYALQLATRRFVMLADKDVTALTRRAVAAWLDVNCHKCSGRGKNGGYDGAVLTICRPCGGSGKSRASLGKTDDERLFVALLLNSMDRKISDGERWLKIYMAGGSNETAQSERKKSSDLLHGVAPVG